MAIALYMDVHIPKAITVELRLRGVDVLTAQEDKADKLPDPELLDRASALNRVLFTFDDDLACGSRKPPKSRYAFFWINLCLSVTHFNWNLY